MAAGEMDENQSLVERRAAERSPITVSLTCRMPASPRPATIRDVSRDGCRIEVPGAPMELGATALLELPGAAKISGRIVWVHGRTAGVRFDRALRGPTAVMLGLEQPPTEVAEPEPEPLEKPSGLLHHWIRRAVAACFS